MVIYFPRAEADNFVDLESSMIHAKFQDHKSSGSEEDVLRFLTYVGRAVILVM